MDDDVKFLKELTLEEIKNDFFENVLMDENTFDLAEMVLDKMADEEFEKYREEMIELAKEDEEDDEDEED